MKFTKKQLEKALKENTYLFEVEIEKLKSMDENHKEWKCQLAACTMLQNEDIRLQKLILGSVL
jgi:hypothetical protein